MVNFLRLLVIWQRLKIFQHKDLKYLRKFLKKKESLHANEISKIADSLPYLRSLVSYCWKISSSEKGFRKIKSFFINLISSLLVTDFNDQWNNYFACPFIEFPSFLQIFVHINHLSYVRWFLFIILNIEKLFFDNRRKSYN